MVTTSHSTGSLHSLRYSRSPSRPSAAVLWSLASSHDLNVDTSAAFIGKRSTEPSALIAIMPSAEQEYSLSITSHLSRIRRAETFLSPFFPPLLINDSIAFSRTSDLATTREPLKSASSRMPSGRRSRNSTAALRRAASSCSGGDKVFVDTFSPALGLASAFGAMPKMEAADSRRAACETTGSSAGPGPSRIDAGFRPSAPAPAWTRGEKYGVEPAGASSAPLIAEKATSLSAGEPVGALARPKTGESAAKAHWACDPRPAYWAAGPTGRPSKDDSRGASCVRRVR